MEARRYRSHDKPANITVSSRTLPGIIVICIGLLITIAGIVLMAAFKLDDITQNTKQMVGPVLGVGIIVNDFKEFKGSVKTQNIINSW